MDMGKVKITNIGFTTAFKKPSTKATIPAVIKLSTVTPGMI